MKDIRLIEMINWRNGSNQSPLNDEHCRRFNAFSYYDEIRVHKVNYDPKEKNIYLQACEAMQRLPVDNPCFPEARQIILAISDKDAEVDIDDFWEKKSPLFFVTMINVPLHAPLSDTVERIETVYEGTDHLTYFTFEYNEVVVFTHTSSLKDYSARVMKLCFEQTSTAVPLDTITISCFDIPENVDQDNVENEMFPVWIQMGTQNYEEASKFFQKYAADEPLFWMLGRSDVGIKKEKSTIKWLRNLTEDLRQNGDWVSTFDCSLFIPAEKKVELKGKGELYDVEWLKKKLTSEIMGLCNQYKVVCSESQANVDFVFLRILLEVQGLILNLKQNQLADDLAICLLLEMGDFINYLRIIFEKVVLEESSIERIRLCVNAFYLNISSIINSTVHGNRQFVQIPHCAAPSFEMPPKLILYFGLMVRQIISAFKDNDKFYGVLLSPQLVDQLDVNSLAVETNYVGKNQLLNVRISENRLYDLKRTIAILGHEMAHFVGETLRNRCIRRQKMVEYYCKYLLSQLFDGMCKRMRLSFTERKEADLLRCFSRYGEVLRNQLVENDSSREITLGELYYEIACLPRSLSRRPEVKNKIIDELLVPNLKEYVQLSCIGLWLKDPCNGQFADGLVKSYLESGFRDALRAYGDRWEKEEMVQSFSDYIGYLFSETYADLAMIKLFKMDEQEYIDVFCTDIGDYAIRNVSEDKIELTRFVAVVRAAYSLRGNATVDEVLSFVSQNDKCYSELQYVCSKIKMDKENVGAEYYTYCIQRDLEIDLIECLVGYLIACSDALDEKFEKDENVKFIRKTHSEMNKTQSIKAQVDIIRKMELDFLTSYKNNCEEEKMGTAMSDS